MTAVIEVTGLTKRYGGQAVVDDISFHVGQGEIFGILGPNGAGKTTTVECIEGLRTPDRGHIRVLGLDPRRDRAEPVLVEPVLVERGVGRARCRSSGSRLSLGPSELGPSSLSPCRRPLRAGPGWRGNRPALPPLSPSARSWPVPSRPTSQPGPHEHPRAAGRF